MKLHEVAGSKSGTALAAIEKFLKDEGAEYYGDDLSKVAVSDKIKKLIDAPGSVVGADELAYFDGDIGDPNAEPHIKDTVGWQEELKDSKWVVKMHRPTPDAMYHQGLIKHNKQPFMYFVTTDGESGTWWIQKLEMK